MPAMIEFRCNPMHTLVILSYFLDYYTDMIASVRRKRYPDAREFLVQKN